jgi:hypothetical protein
MTKEEWQISKELQLILSVPNRITVLLQEQKNPTISQLVPKILLLCSILTSLLNDEELMLHSLSIKVVKKLLKSIKTRFDYLKSPIFLLSSLFDPRTKEQVYQYLPQKTKKKVEIELQKLIFPKEQGEKIPDNTDKLLKKQQDILSLLSPQPKVFFFFTLIFFFP